MSGENDLAGRRIGKFPFWLNMTGADYLCYDTNKSPKYVKNFLEGLKKDCNGSLDRFQKDLIENCVSLRGNEGKPFSKAEINSELIIRVCDFFRPNEREDRNFHDFDEFIWWIFQDFMKNKYGCFATYDDETETWNLVGGKLTKWGEEDE